MPDSLYDSDILLWSQTMAELLRRMQAGERVNTAIDWPNLIDEVEDVGRSELNACISHLRQALVDLLKLGTWPHSRSAGQWRGEVIAFLADAAQEFSPSMRQKIDLPKLYGQALMVVRAAIDDSGPPMTLSDECPFKLDQLLTEDVGGLWSAGGS